MFDPSISLTEGMTNNRPLYIKSDQDGFLFDPDVCKLEVDAVHCFAVVRRVISFYLRIMPDLKRWQWNTGEVLNVYPYGSKENGYASYTRDTKSLRFGLSAVRGKDEVKRLCQSFDIVAHEAGHAILDAIREDLNTRENIEAKAFGETFADITVGNCVPCCSYST